MKIVNVEDTFSRGNKFGYKLRIKCDCGRLFETDYSKEIIWKPNSKIIEKIDYKYCPYCARKIIFEELN